MQQQVPRQSQQQVRKSVTQIHLFNSILNKLGNDNLACLLCCISSIAWVIGFIYPNQHNFSFSLTIFIRGFTVIVTSYLVCLRFEYWTDFKDPLTFRQLFFRNLVMVTHGILFAVVPFYLPQFLIHTISCAGPLFVFVVDYYSFGITINRKQFSGIIIGVFGIVFAVNGQLITSYVDPSFVFKSEFANYRTTNVLKQFMVSICIVAVVFIWGFAVCHTKTMKSNGIQISLFLGYMLIIASGIAYPFTSDPINIPTTTQILYGFLFSGIPICVSTIFGITAFSIAINSGLVTMTTFVAVVVSYLVSIFRYGQAINYICLFGAVLTIFGVTTVVLNKQGSRAPALGLHQTQETSKKQVTKI